MLLWLLLACPAEQLGVPVPRRGVDAIAEEDLRRDLRALTHGPAGEAGPPGEALRRTFLTKRMAAVGLSARAGCGVRAGVGAERVAVVAAPAAPGDRSGWLAAAVVISVAKAFDRRPPHRRALLFCVAEVPDDAVRLAWVGPLGAGETVWRIADGAPIALTGVDLSADLVVTQTDPATGEPDLVRAVEVARALVPIVERWADGE